MSDGWFVRAPASSANLGAGFDVFGMALDLFADCGLGEPPDGARQLDDHHPGRHAFEAAGGSGPVWMRCNIPMGRGLGFSGAARVAAIGLALVQQHGPTALIDRSSELLAAATELEGHGDNVGASIVGGVTAYVGDRCLSIPVGPVLGSASLVAWIPDVTTSTDKSRRTLGSTVDRVDAVHNVGRSVQFVMAFVDDDPSLLAGGVDDRLHQAQRLALVDGASDAIRLGVDAGAWAGWLSGSGPTVGLLCSSDVAASVAMALPGGGHSKILQIDSVGCRIER